MKIDCDKLIAEIESKNDVTLGYYTSLIKKDLSAQLKKSYGATDDEIEEYINKNMPYIKGKFVESYNYAQTHDQNFKEKLDKNGVTDGAVYCLYMLY